MKLPDSSCPCCHSRESSFLYRLSYGDVQKCTECKTAYTSFLETSNITETNKEFAKTNNLTPRLYDQKRFRKEARQRLRLLKKYISKGSILEFGSWTGEFAYEAAMKDFDITSVDLHPNILNINKTKKLKEIKSDANTFKSPHKYDCIAAFHVIEHLTSPAGFVSNCYDQLKPGGILFLEIPNFESLSRKLFGKKSGIFYDYHLCHFDNRSIKTLLGSNGLKTLITRTVDNPTIFISPFYSPLRHALWNGLRTIIPPKTSPGNIPDNRENIISSKADEESIISSGKAKVYRAESSVMNAISMFFSPLSLLQNYFKLGSNLQVIATKPESKFSHNQ